MTASRIATQLQKDNLNLVLERNHRVGELLLSTLFEQDPLPHLVISNSDETEFRNKYLQGLSFNLIATNNVSETSIYPETYKEGNHRLNSTIQSIF
jgi:hypothetical protein